MQLVKRATLSLVVLLAMAASAMAATPPAQAGQVAQAVQARQEQPQKKVVKIGASQAVDSMNPFLAVRLISTSIHRYMYGFLTVPDPKTLQPSGDLAEKWTTSEDGLTWTFTIRENVKWSDGQPVTAEDAAWTLQKIMDDDAAKTANGPAVENFDEVEATDAQTLVIKTKEPQASMLELPIPIMPKHKWEGIDKIGDFENDEFPVVSNGPYVAVEHKKDQFVRLEANPDYWRGRPKIDELHVIFYETDQAMIAGLRNGEVDWVGRLFAPEFDSVAGVPDIKQLNTPGRRSGYLQLNPGAATKEGKPIGDGHPAMKDVRVRQAMHHAIDKQTLVKELLNGHGQPANGSIVPPMMEAFHWSAEGEEVVGFDLDKANQILEDAGYKKGGDGVRTMPDGKRKLEMRFTSHTDTPVEEKLAEFVTGWFKEIGIAVKTQKRDATKFTEETGVTGLYDIAVSGWSVNPDPEEVMQTHLCSRRPTAKGEGGGTESFYCDKEFEDLYQKQLTELDRPKRVQLLKEMQRKLYTDAPVIAMYYVNNLEAYRTDRVAGFETVPVENGHVYGASGYWPVYTLEAATRDTGQETGVNTGLIAGLVALAVIVIGGGALFLARRRRATAEDRE